MLRPSKHSHPDRTVVNTAVLILLRLKNRRAETFDALRAYVHKTIPSGDVIYVPALDLLFLLGLVEYRPKGDTFEYVGPNEAI